MGLGLEGVGLAGVGEGLAGVGEVCKQARMDTAQQKKVRSAVVEMYYAQGAWSTILKTAAARHVCSPAQAMQPLAADLQLLPIAHLMDALTDRPTVQK